MQDFGKTSVVSQSIAMIEVDVSPHLLEVVYVSMTELACKVEPLVASLGFNRTTFSLTVGVRCNRQNGIRVKLCRLASEKHRIGLELVSEAIS